MPNKPPLFIPMQPTQTQTGPRALAPAAIRILQYSILNLKFPLLAALLALLSTLNPQLSASPLGTAFTYQGQLTDGGRPAQGSYDLRFTLYDAVTNGSAIAGPITNSPVGVTNGLFTTTLDFGVGVFTAAARWLEIAVRTNGGGAFTALWPLQELTPAPCALYATNAGAAAYAALAGSALTASNTPWSGLTGVPADFADGVDNDTTYTAGTGLTLAGTVLSAHFAGSGVANTVARGDHDHGGVYAPTNHQHNAADLASGTLADARLSDNVPLLSGSPTFGGTVRVRNASPAVQCVNSGDSNRWIQMSYNSYLGPLLQGDGYPRLTLDADADATGTIVLGVGGDRVGIGVLDPASALDVNGTVTATAFSGSGAGLTALNGATLTAGSVASAALANSAVTTAKIADNAVTAARLASGAVGTAALADASVTSAKILDGVIATADLTNGAVTSGKLASEAASLAKVSGGTMAVSGTDVGIGTTSPIRKLHVRDGSGRDGDGAAIQVGGTGANEDAKLIYFGGDERVYLGEKGANDRMELRAGEFYFDTGNVGIGTATPDCKLEVNGDVRAGRLSIGTNHTLSGVGATIAGGEQNANAAQWATLGGGRNNRIETDAVGASLAGGVDNHIQSTAWYGTIPGGYGNRVAGYCSFAAGRQAIAGHPGCFVWADSAAGGFSSSSADQFLIRAAGGVGIGTSFPAQKLHVAGRIRMEQWVPDGATAVYRNAAGDFALQASDARLKQNVTLITNALAAVRRMTGVTFNWRGDAPGARKTAGLLAHEVQAALPELTFECQGEDGQTYLGVHYEKVTAVLVNALREEAAQVAAQEAEITALKERVAKLERLLVEKKGGAQ
jgi:hypothetical protein